jgi:uncharacterized membrane protein YjjP (DUF1212 family)
VQDDGVDGFDVVVRVARLGLESSGEGVEMLQRYVARAAAAYDVPVTAVILAEQVVVTDDRSDASVRVAAIRAAPGIFRLDQVAALKRVLVDIEKGMDASTACRVLDEIGESRPHWPRWLRVVGVMMFAVGFAPSIVASWNEVAATAVLGLLMGVLVVASAGTRVEGLIPFLGAFLVTVVALTVMLDLTTTTGVTLLVIPSLFIVVPGDTLSAAAGELLAGHITTGATRLVYGAFVLGLIVVGIVAGAGVTGHLDVLTETLPQPSLPYAVILAGWVVFSAGLVLAFNAEPGTFLWLTPSVLATYLLQQGATAMAGAVVGTLVAGVALAAFANFVDFREASPPRLILILGGFFVLTDGGVGVRGVTALFGSDVISGVDDLADFALQVPTVALALAIGVALTEPLRSRAVSRS